MEGCLSKKEFHENPLVPNKKLRQMYVAMAEARVLDEHIAKLQKRAKSSRGKRTLESTRGQEACRVSTAIDLGPGDLVSDSQEGLVMDLLAGAKAGALLERLTALTSGKKAKGTKLGGTSGRLLPWIDDAGERLRMAMGAALSFKALERPNIVVAYVRSGELAKGEWREVLKLAAKLELSVIFVVLPAEKKSKGSGTATLSPKTSAWGVPGIAVDASDAVALYRVAQESIGRTRAGDGPVLIECVLYTTERKGEAASHDPLVLAGEFLLSRKVCTRAWLKGAGSGLRRRIDAVKT
jgi:acetoin:2,6-dichlorophenolindophenol oxidoreductase subunit alpha